MINPISDGQPITYDLLNQIITQVNSMTSPNYEKMQFIEIIDSGNLLSKTETEKTVIVVGKERIILDAKKRQVDKEVTFPSDANFSATPYITTSLIDTKLGPSGAGLNYGDCTIIDRGKGNFKVRVSLVAPKDVETGIEINYIAIGPSSNA